MEYKESAEDNRGREGKLNGNKSETDINHERLWTSRKKLRVVEGICGIIGMCDGH